jgi:hypothetical protein
MGDGPIDLVVVPGIINNVELFHEIPGYTDFFERLARFARVVVFRTFAGFGMRAATGRNSTGKLMGLAE